MVGNWLAGFEKTEGESAARHTGQCYRTCPYGHAVGKAWDCHGHGEAGKIVKIIFGTPTYRRSAPKHAIFFAGASTHAGVGPLREVQFR
jgi:hypothetical protein